MSNSTRIYDLAREIGNRFQIEVKATDLAKEIRENPEFRSIRDQIKSHASTVDEDVARKMFDLYGKRSGASKSGGARPTASAPAAARPTPTVTPQIRPGAGVRPSAAPPPAPRELSPREIEEERARKAAEEKRRREEINVLRQARDPRRPTPPPVSAPNLEGARMVRKELLQHQHRPGPAGAAPVPPRPAVPPIAPRQPRIAPIPLPIQKTVGEPPAAPPASVAPAAAAPPPAPAPAAAAPAVAPPAPAPKPATPVPSAVPPRVAPAPAAPAASAPSGPAPAPVAAAPAPSGPIRPTASAPTQPPPPSMLRAPSGPGAGAPRPGSGPMARGPVPGGGRPVSPGGPGGYRSDRGPGGASSGGPGGGYRSDRGPSDRGGQRGPGGPGGAGGYRSDRGPSDRGPGGPGGRGPRDDRGRGPGAPPPPRFRDTGLGQPPPPPLPNFGKDSIFRKREAPPPRREEERRPPGPGVGPGAEARRPGGPDRPERPERPGRPGAAEKPGGLVIPTLESMKETPRRRPGGGPAAKAPPPKKKGLKTIVREEIEVKPTRIYSSGDEFRRPVLGKKAARPAQRGAGRPGPRGGGSSREAGPPAARQAGPVHIGATITVGEFAERLSVPAAEIIRRVFLMGRPLTINALIDPELCELVAQDLGIELAVEAEGDEHDVEQYRPLEASESAVRRPPVVTIMGHVDHGKTTLLDAYRSSRVVEGEFGGITQHIGAYRVQTPRGEVTFLDTPGHAAFTQMRARGAKVTDIVILVVGADDGVMPQTVEAINHAREANVPIIVAVNKIDLPQANPQKVRNELMQHQILPEELGGSNIFVEVSAKKRLNLDQLLEMVLLQAEVLELKADPTCRAEGTIIESHVDPLRGAVATVLVQKGTLKQGDVFVVGTQSGRVRGMIDDKGRQVKEATPAHPVEVIGLTGTPEAGELFVVMAEERMAREIASRRVDRRRMKDLGTTRHVSLEGLHALVAEGKLKDLKVILRADVQGSVEAIRHALTKLSNPAVRVSFLHASTGGVTESDVNLAAVSDAIIMAFNVRPDPAAAALAQQEGIEIKTYRVIYELIDEVQKAIVGMLDKTYREVVTGRAEIRQVFRASRIGSIAGCMVQSGEITRGSEARVVRDQVIVYQGKIGTLRRIKDDVQKVASGFECGLTLENYNDIKEGDVVETFKMIEEAGVLPVATEA